MDSDFTCSPHQPVDPIQCLFVYLRSLPEGYPFLVCVSVCVGGFVIFAQIGIHILLSRQKTGRRGGPNTVICFISNIYAFVMLVLPSPRSLPDEFTQTESEQHPLHYYIMLSSPPAGFRAAPEQHF